MSKMKNASLLVKNVRVKNYTKLHDLCLVINSASFKNKIDFDKALLFRKKLSKAINVGDLSRYFGVTTPTTSQIVYALNGLNLGKGSQYEMEIALQISQVG